MKRATALGLMRSILLALADGEDFARCQGQAEALLDIVAARGLSDA